MFKRGRLSTSLFCFTFLLFLQDNIYSLILFIRNA
uniref:Uncharacterized protein n=1 Tax=Siphoviridae sp. cteEJ17 TaxID=2827904 RepID=A0A8S5T184_9CAUD|nr:MAG TPA: hypothetical protein [Siphoviridae sp. cteEJ17]